MREMRNSLVVMVRGGRGLAGILDRHFGLDDEVSINPDPGSIGDPIVDVGTRAPAAEADGVAMLGSYRSAEGAVPGDFDLVEVVLKDVVHGVGGCAVDRRPGGPQ